MTNGQRRGKPPDSHGRGWCRLVSDVHFDILGCFATLVLMKVLVTGGAGFIGSHVVEGLLQRGAAVTVVDDFNDFYAPSLKYLNVTALRDHVRLVEVSICELPTPEEVSNSDPFDAIIYLNERAGVRPSLVHPRIYTELSILGTQNLLEFASTSGERKFTFASWSSVYVVNQKAPVNEPNPISPYAPTKLAGEALCHLYHHAYRLEVVCARQRPDLPIRKSTEALLAGKPIDVFGDGSTRHDCTHIDGILQAALARNFRSGIINLGDPQIPIEAGIARFFEWYQS